jgi:hypothetical protein
MRQPPNQAAHQGPNGPREILPLRWKQNVFRVRPVARFGLLDMRAPAEVPSVLRTDTPLLEDL